MTTPRIRLSVLVAAAAAAALVLLPATAASAHDDLVSSNPAADASIDTDPGAVDLVFSEALLSLGDTTDGFALQVVDSEGLHYESGCVTIADAHLSAPIALGDAGGYQVIWQVVSSDGHPTSGQYAFDYEPASIDGAAEGLTDAPVCGEAWAGEPDGAPAAAPSSEAPATASAAPTVSDGTLTATHTAGAVTGELETPAAGLPWYAVAGIVVVGLGVIAALIVVVLRRMRGGGYGQP